MTWKIDDPEGNESAKIKWELVEYTTGQGLDLGCGPWKAFNHFIGVDNYTDTKLFGVEMKPDVVSDVTKLSVFGSASMDFVYSSHCLEHVTDWQAALKEWWRVIKPSGYLILYLPDEDEYPKVGEKGANPDHKWNVNIPTVVDAMKDIGCWDLVRCEKRNQDFEYSIFFVFKKRDKGHQYTYKAPKPEKTCGIVRYGATGDLIQLSSILPGLKEQGYHITLFCTPSAKEVVKHDPHIDCFYVQGTDQVPNPELPLFWGWHEKKFDKWLNLSESVEAQWLTFPGRSSNLWPLKVKQKYLDVNYAEFTHDMADVPMPPRPKFYATPDEQAWAKKEKARMGSPLIMYALSGSGVNKVWPHMDQLFARIMLHTKAHIVCVGAGADILLQQGWEQEPRVHLKADKYTIRESLSLVAECDLVIGPETGMLNAASHLPMGKVVFLSHSSANNLTKHWVNTIALASPFTPCYPCHKMIYSWADCKKDEAYGTAHCSSSISADMAWDAVCTLMP
jgi:ADP-heptose:LPS heptosyltransferase/predicted SAM-dependent methyltransferase